MYRVRPFNQCSTTVFDSIWCSCVIVQHHAKLSKLWNAVEEHNVSLTSRNLFKFDDIILSVFIWLCYNPLLIQSDGFVFLAYDWREDPVYWFIDRHICQGSFNDRVLWHGCSTVKVLYKVQHSKGPCLCGLKRGQPHFEVKGDCIPLSAQHVSLKRWFSSSIPLIDRCRTM